MVDPMKKPPQPRRSRLELWISLALLAAIIAVYAQVRSFAFINYDDPDYVTANTHVLSGLNPQSLAWAFTSTQDANWFPLTRLSHLADVQLFGLDAGAHHLTNVAIHGLSALLLFVLLKRITRASWPSAFAAFVFAVHPLHVESVAWVSERKDVLSGLFWMLTLWAYLRYSDRTTFARYSLVVLLFCCGLMAKPMIVTLPFVMLLIDYWRERPGWKRLILEKIPLFAIAIAAGIATFVIQQRGGSVSTIAQVPLQLRLGNAAASYIIYLAQFLWPAKLAVFYPFVAQSVWMEVSAVLTLLVVTFTVLRRGVPRYLTIGWLWYVGTLFPVIGLIQVGAQSRADRYTYIPLIGISIAIAFGAAELIERRPSLRPAIAACAVAACIAWTAVAMSYASDWQSSIALFEHAAHATRANYIAYNNLGDALRDAGRPTEAIRNFEMAVEIKPASPRPRTTLAKRCFRKGVSMKPCRTFSKPCAWTRKRPRRASIWAPRCANVECSKDPKSNIAKPSRSIPRTPPPAADWAMCSRSRTVSTKPWRNIAKPFASSPAIPIRTTTWACSPPRWATRAKRSRSSSRSCGCSLPVPTRASTWAMRSRRPTASKTPPRRFRRRYD